MPYVILAIVLSLSSCGIVQQGHLQAQAGAAKVDVSTLRATDVTIKECGPEDSGQVVELRPKQLVSADQLAGVITSAAAIMCGLQP